MYDVRETAADAPDGIDEALGRVLASKTFARSAKLRRLLEHIVRESRADRSDRLLGKVIASDVFGVDGDDATDHSGVRVEIGRLRARLHHYYITEGADDPIVMDIPKGAYIAAFRRNPKVPRAVPGPPARHGLRRRIPHPIWLAGAVVLVIGCVALVTLVRTPASVVPPLPRLAVAGIEDLSDAADYIAIGLTSDLVNRLARFSHIVMVSRGAMTGQDRIGASSVELRAGIAADYVLEGVLRPGPGGLRLNFELRTAPANDVVWVGEFLLADQDRGLPGAQLDVANAVARALAARDGAVPRLAAGTGELAADRPSYECVLRFYAYTQRRAPDEHAAVRDCLEAAARRTPDYAEVWTSLAQVYLDEVRNAFPAAAGAAGAPVDRAMQAALTAAALAPDSASAQSVLAATRYFRRDMDAFRADARRALDLNPNDADMHAYLGHLLSMAGDWPEGLALIEQAKAMSPTHPPLWHHAPAMAAMLEEDYERALAAAKQGEMPQFYMSHVILAALHGHRGDGDAARDAVAKLEALRPDYLAAMEADMRQRHFQPDLIDTFRRGLGRAYELAMAP